MKRRAAKESVACMNTSPSVVGTVPLMLPVCNDVVDRALAVNISPSSISFSSDSARHLLFPELLASPEHFMKMLSSLFSRLAGELWLGGNNYIQSVST